MQAFKIYYDLHVSYPESEEILVELTGLNLHLENIDHAIDNLNKLVRINPFKKAYYDQLANCHARLGNWSETCDVFHALLLQRPKSPDAHFNLAFYSRKNADFQKSLDSYQRALDLKIARPEEVYVNMAVICSEDLQDYAQARAYLEDALAANPVYVPALYNLANYYEDLGHKDNSIKCFQKILDLQPANAKTLARMAYINKYKSCDDGSIEKMHALFDSTETLMVDKIDLGFALGKIYDDCEKFDKAFDFYRRANELEKNSLSTYSHTDYESFVAAIIEFFDENWIARFDNVSKDTPVFICGMFRSGSTLIEQILASHPEVSAGGEKEYILKLVENNISPFPSAAKNLNRSTLRQYAKSYIENATARHPDARYITDKRPDNLIFIGLIKAMFPHARIIFTERNALDNCLSVYFTRLQKRMNYANNLEDIYHHYQQHSRLKKHWHALFKDALYTVNYDELIVSPRDEISKMLDYLGLPWHDNCLQFEKLDNPVRTASAWQIRQPLYASSSGRWKNYQEQAAVKNLHKLVNQQSQ
ncbi:MAG: sulfotransferase [Gammaproteobacteria bacterium]|nr:sulfotransferase [Gammaproteobacteria bacterium]NNM14455.1 tetratricopeptide repeat protein [Gammaproteobacteria bacterium]